MKPFPPTALRTTYCSWLRRLIVATSALTGVLAIGIVCMIAANRFDDDLHPSAKAWLEYPAPTPPPAARNGYLALLSLDSQASEPIAAAEKFVLAQHAIHAEAQIRHEETVSRYHAQHTLLLNPRSPSKSYTDCRMDCYDVLSRKNLTLDKFSNANADLQARYSAMLDLTAYAEILPADSEAHYPMRTDTPYFFFELYNHHLASTLGLIHLRSVIATLESGDAGMAYRELARYQRFWQMAAANSISQKGSQHALKQLVRSQSLLLQMLQAHPDSRAAARRHIGPVIAEKPSMSEARARSMIFNFQIVAQYLNSLLERSDTWTFDDRMQMLFFQKNVTLNLLQDLYRNELAQHQVRLLGDVPPMQAASMALCERLEKPWYDWEFWHWSLVFNPMGKSQVCELTGTFLTQAIEIDRSAKDIANRLAP